MPDWVLIVVFVLVIAGAFTWGPWVEARRTVGKEAWRNYRFEKKVSEFLAHSYALRGLLFLVGLLAVWYVSWWLSK